MSQHFDQQAAQWDTPDKIQRSLKHSQVLLNLLQLNYPIRILEFGCGTGLLSLSLIEQMANKENLKDSDPWPFLEKLIGIDTSQGMIDVFNKKAQKHPQIQGVCLNLEQDALSETQGFHLILSTMAFHHLESPRDFTQKLSELMAPQGVLAIIDLDKEDGSFHPDNSAMGVKHFGFSFDEIKKWQNDQLQLLHHSLIDKIDKNGRSYPLFLAIFKSLRK